jgi:hypothetical protein
MTLPRKVWKKTGGMLALDPLDPQALALGPLDALAHIPEPLASGASGAWSGTSGPRPGSPPAPDPLDPQVLAPERKTGSFFFPRHCLERKTSSFFFPKVALAGQSPSGDRAERRQCSATSGGAPSPSAALVRQSQPSAFTSTRRQLSAALRPLAALSASRCDLSEGRRVPWSHRSDHSK